MADKNEPLSGLALLRKPFPPNQISKLPKPTKAQTDAVKADFKKGERCQICGTWHHPAVIHLDYVGHAALTDRLLDADPFWNWEPLCVDERGAPLLDQRGGLWIRLTVCGHSRIGYGGADGKTGTDAIKEIIGDALRNAAMRFGAALDLWHKGDLHLEDEGDEGDGAPPLPPPPDAAPHVKKENGKYTGMTGPNTKTVLQTRLRAICHDLEGITDAAELEGFLIDNGDVIEQLRTDFPGWWDKEKSPENDFEGLKQRIERTRRRLSDDPFNDNLPTLAAG